MKKYIIIVGVLALMCSCNSFKKEFAIDNVVSTFIEKHSNYDINSVVYSQSMDLFNDTITSYLKQENTAINGMKLLLISLDKNGSECLAKFLICQKSKKYTYSGMVVCKISEEYIYTLKTFEEYTITGNLINKEDINNVWFVSAEEEVSFSFAGIKDKNVINLGILYYNTTSIHEL